MSGGAFPRPKPFSKRQTTQRDHPLAIKSLNCIPVERYLTHLIMRHTAGREHHDPETPRNMLFLRRVIGEFAAGGFSRN
jgi:hypothetical protein